MALLFNLNTPKKGNPLAPTLILSLTAFKKMRWWVDKAAAEFNYEISGIGTASKRKGIIFINDIWLIKPEKVGGAIVDMDPAAIQLMMLDIATNFPRFRHLKPHIDEYLETGTVSDTEAFMEIADILSKEGRFKSLKFFWHSHVNFAVGWSGTDDRSARTVLPKAKWTVNLVTNTHGHYLARMDFPRTQEEPLHDLPIKLQLPFEKYIRDKYTNLYQENFSRHMPSRGEEVTLEDLMGVEEPKQNGVQKKLALPPPPSYSLPHKSSEG